jgi:hypothetical protein
LLKVHELKTRLSENFAMQCQTFVSRVFEDVYAALPGKSAYEQQEHLLWEGLTALLKSLGPGAMRELVRRHPEIRRECIQRTMDLQQPNTDTTCARKALLCIRLMLQV